MWARLISRPVSEAFDIKMVRILLRRRERFTYSGSSKRYVQRQGDGGQERQPKFQIDLDAYGTYLN